MSILGFLTHVLVEDVAAVEKKMIAVPELTTYGIHNETYIVAVADAFSSEMEAVVNCVKAMDGVIAVYVTSYTMEDEENNSSSFPPS